MADVFLSYKREDSPRVRKLASALRAQGLEIWWDHDIPPASPWEATIETELARAKAVIVCWSPDAVASDNVRSEARIARQDGRLIQVFMGSCTPPLFFGERQGVDLSTWRGKANDLRIARIAEAVRAVSAGERAAHEPPPRARAAIPFRMAAVAVALCLLVAGIAGWWYFRSGGYRGPVTVAVLPFRALNPADANLVDAIWDDTRGALSHNPNLRVLGRTAVERLAQDRLDPAEYRQKTGAQYLLDGTVQHVGNRVEIKVSLVNTADASEMWSDRIGGRLDDVFEFQNRIAREVEGRVRGRIAPGGGVRSENIATSGEVYSIFADAKANARKRDRDSLGQAIMLLRKALAIDPNFAPAWAELGSVTKIYQPSGEHPDKVRTEAISDLQRALTLAPNLAHAHAALAMVQGFPPSTESNLKRAVALDPNDAEAWTWLGNFYAGQNRLRESLVPYSRAVEVEPLWYTGIANKIQSLSGLSQSKAVDQELRRVASVHDPRLLLKVKAHAAINAGQIGDGARLLLELRDRYPDETSFANPRLLGPLLALGYVDEAARVGGFPPDAAAYYRGEIQPSLALLKKYGHPIDFWTDDDFPALVGRILRKSGRLPEFAKFYGAAFHSPDEYFAAFASRPRELMAIGPNVAANLSDAGKAASAATILLRTESIMAPLLHNGPATRDLLFMLAELRAAEGKDDQAIQFLTQAVARAWLPDRAYFATDIAEEPSFARLRGRADFEAIRQKLLRRLDEQRRQLGKVPFALTT